MSGKIDLVVRNGLIFDGTGAAPFQGDVGVDDGKIVALGTVEARGREEIDAAGALVMPGFVDIHSHYDGHATWASHLNPSGVHGVTTVIMGNCGVGFAPCKPADRDKLVRLMEGVEDIPEIVMTEGIPWCWETFPEYLDFLDGRSFNMDVAAQLPHAPLRVYVMGERGAAREPATLEDVAAMRELTREAIEAGALGFSTSRSLNHRGSDGELTPSQSAAERELLGIADGLRDSDRGVIQIISDFADLDAEFGLIRRMSEQSGRPASLSLMQFANDPDRWRAVLDRISAANRDGLEIKAQVCGRPVGALIGLELSFNPFSFCPSYQPIAKLPIAERAERMRDPALRARLIAEYPCDSFQAISPALRNLDRIFLMGEFPEYEPDEIDSVGGTARALGVEPVEHMYELLIARGGTNVFYIPAANYVDGTIDAPRAMLHDPNTVLGLGDGGAHCGIVCDASLTTYMLTRWGSGDRTDSLPLARVVKMLTADTASAVGLGDRGRIALGYRGDLNIVDMTNIRLHRPEIVYDLPTGGGRLHQRADGYVATIVRGEITYRNGEPTGALPGRLVRGQRELVS